MKMLRIIFSILITLSMLTPYEVFAEDSKAGIDNTIIFEKYKVTDRLPIRVIQEENPFDDIEITFSGLNGDGSIHTSSPVTIDIANGNLTNGDVLTLSLENKTKSVVVEGLPEIWDEFSLLVSGRNGSGTVSIIETNPAVDYRLGYRTNRSGNLRNGNFVLVKAYNVSSNDLLEIKTIQINNLN